MLKNMGIIPSIFVPNPALAMAPVTVAAGKVLTLDSTGWVNDGVLVNGSPKLGEYGIVVWEEATELYVQTYLNADTTKLSAPSSSRAEGLHQDLTAYNIKNTTAGNVTIHIGGM